MTEISSNNKRIAKNTLMLYIRMGLGMVVSLYTSRIVLQTLGVEDYGIYGVVGGVVAMFSFLNTTMARATSRFLTFEMGKNNKERLKITFSSALIIHIGIALLVLILAETVGVWFLNNKLVIPEGRMGAAHWVLQLSILGTMVGITQVPYNATIIAHEKMDVYAYVELIDVFLKLGIVYILYIGDFDKLILYAFLILVVSVIKAMIYRLFCIRYYEESRFKWVWDKEIMKPMLSFSGLNLYVSMCFTARTQGTTFLINIFFGVISNTANNIATTVDGVLNGLAYNIITASQPNIIKSYSQNKLDEMQNTMRNSIKFSTLFFTLIAIPFYFETPFIIKLWLGQVPYYVVSFIRIALIINFIRLINSVITISLDATGNIKLYSIMTGTINLIALPVSFLLFKIGYDAQFAYVVCLLSFILILTTNIYLLKQQIREIRLHSILLDILQLLLIVIISILLGKLLYTYVPSGIYRLISVIICNTIVVSLLTYFIVLNKDQRKYVNEFISQKILRKYKRN